nr:glycosyltransferase family 2 protein [Desulforapulum autotrophicum]
MSPRLSIVFLNFNRLEETRHTLERIWQFCENRDDIEIIGVDNASSDGTREYLRSWSDRIQVIELEENTGIVGLNKGFEQACGDYIFVLDDDSYPVDSACLDRLIDCLDTHKDIGLVACRIETPLEVPVRSWHLPLTDIPQESMAFVGCGFAVRRVLFKRVGWFPESFFLYQNEMEVAFQVAGSGWHIHYAPGCRVVHREAPKGRTGWRQVFFPTRNTIWLIRKYASPPFSVYFILSRMAIGLFRALQAGEFACLVKAVNQGLKANIVREKPSSDMDKRFKTFWLQNSLIHQLFYLFKDPQKSVKKYD